jgi:hypothetical protein
MTFIVGVDGVVYQKDLGKKTEVLAKGMKEYNPDSSWQKTEVEQEEAAAEPKTSSAAGRLFLANVSVEHVNQCLQEYIQILLWKCQLSGVGKHQIPQHPSLET